MTCFTNCSRENLFVMVSLALSLSKRRWGPDDLREGLGVREIPALHMWIGTRGDHPSPEYLPSGILDILAHLPKGGAIAIDRHDQKVGCILPHPAGCQEGLIIPVFLQRPTVPATSAANIDMNSNTQFAANTLDERNEQRLVATILGEELNGERPTHRGGLAGRER